MSQSTIETDDFTERWFPYEKIRTNRVNLIISPCGTGKTSAISQYIENECDTFTIMVISYRQTLAQKLAKSFNFLSYLDIPKGKRLLQEDYPRIVISVESMLRLSQISNETQELYIPLPDVLIIDEFASQIEHIFNPKTLDVNRCNLFINFFCAMLCGENKTVLLADAYFNDDTVELLGQLTETLDNFPLERLLLIRNFYRGEKRIMYVTHSCTLWLARLHETLTKTDSKIYLFSNWKIVLDGLYKKYKKKKTNPLTNAPEISTSNYPEKELSNVLYLSSESSTKDKLNSSQETDTEWSSYDHVFVSPVITAGVSFDVENHFDLVFGFAGPHSAGPLSVLQHIHRVRHPTTNEIWLYLPKSTVKKGLPKTYSDADIIRLMLTTNTFTEECRNILQPTFTVQENKLKINYDKSNVLNMFLILHMKQMLKASDNFFGSLRLLALGDNFEFVYVKEAKKPEGLPLEEVPENDDHLVLQNLMNLDEDEIDEIITQDEINEDEDFENILKEIPKKHRKIKYIKNKGDGSGLTEICDIGKAGNQAVFENWDGFFYTTESADKFIQPLVSLEHFIKNWNVLGLYGDFSKMITVHHRFFTISSDVMFNAEACGKFYVDFVAGHRQQKFHDFVKGVIDKQFFTDYDENEHGRYSDEAMNAQFLYRLFDLAGICSSTFYLPEDETLRVLGLGTKFPNRSLELQELNEAYNRGEVSREQWLEKLDEIFPYRQEVVMQKFFKETDKCFSEFHESTFNNPPVILKLRELLKKYWAVVYPRVKRNSKMDIDPNKCTCLKSNSSLANDSELMRIAVVLVRQGLKDIGLQVKRNPRPKDEYLFGCSKRKKFYRFEIINFRERLMISLCRELLERNIVAGTVLWYPEADPFHLLQYDPRSRLPTLNRFNVIWRNLYKPLVELYKTQSGYFNLTTGEDYTEQTREHTEKHFPGGNLRPITHTLINFDNIICFLSVWKFFEPLKIDFTETVYSPAFRRTLTEEKYQSVYKLFEYEKNGDNWNEVEQEPMLLIKTKLRKTISLRDWDLISYNDRVETLKNCGLNEEEIKQLNYR